LSWSGLAVYTLTTNALITAFVDEGAGGSNRYTSVDPAGAA